MQFVKETYIIENTESAKRSMYHLDEISIMHEDVTKNLNANLKIPKDVIDSFKIHSELNSDIWKGEKLIPDVRKKLLKIAIDFFKTLKLPPNIKFKDVLLVGSLANYNWSKYSDVDIHLVIDFNELDSNHEQVKQSLDSQKNLWNLKHDITIFKYPVEIYVQDVKEKLESSAIYSVAHDKWILMPEQQKFKLDKTVIKNRIDKFFNKMKDIKYDYDTHKYSNVIQKVDDFKALIKKMRQSGLEKGGEFSTENLVFKILRRTAFMEILDTYKTKAYDKIVSIKK